MKKRGPNYDAAILSQWQKNLQDVATAIGQRAHKVRDENLQKKIDTFARNFGFERSDVIGAIRKSKYLQAAFATDPRRQGIDERTAFTWLGRQKEISGLKKLPPRGEQARYVTAQGVIQLGKGGSGLSKSLDFEWRTGATTFYAMHKRTTDDGGTQGNVEKEMERLLLSFKKCKRKDIALVLILDGDYWSADRIEVLRTETRATAPKSFVAPIGDIPDILKEFL